MRATGLAVFVSWATACMTACAPAATSDGDDDPGEPDVIDAGAPPCQGAGCTNACPANMPTTLSGTVTFPNGIEPVPGAFVYMPRTISEFPERVTCNLCEDIYDQAFVMTQTAADGTFTLGPIPTAENQLPGTRITFIVEKGHFRRVTEIAIETPCGHNAAAEEEVRLPARTEGRNQVPRIAVATGDYDSLECTLVRMGLDPAEIDVFDQKEFEDWAPPAGPFAALLGDADRLQSYDLVFVNCTPAVQYAYGTLASEIVRDNIIEYVNRGGRLFVTDRAYGFVDAMGPWTGWMDFSQNGQGGVGDARVLDDELALWLNAVEARTGEDVVSDLGTIPVGGWAPGWVVQTYVQEPEVKVWMEGTAPVLPLTSTFDVNTCGRVLFSSYHTAGTSGSGPFPAYCTGAPTSQERVLMYLMLFVADCITVE
jgi:hypothetical protein